MKRTGPDGGNATTYRDTGQTTAVLKRLAPYASDTVRDSDGTGYAFGALDEVGLGQIIQDAI